MEVLESVSPSELDDVVERVLDAVEKQPCKYNMNTTDRSVMTVQSVCAALYVCFCVFLNRLCRL